MPGHTISFIGRGDELGQIERLIREQATRRVVCIKGVGGIGKTRLLQEVRARYAEDKGQVPLLVADIIDFDDRELHLAENVERRIAQRLGEKAFGSYLRGFLDWRKMEAAGVSPEALEQQEKLVHQALVDGLNRVSSERRVVLMLDTIEKLESKEAWNRLFDLILESKNTLFLLAGRCDEAAEFWDFARSRMGEKDMRSIELQPLEQAAGWEYLEEKQRQLHINLGADLARKLLLLARGRPILIDLAVEWLSRDFPLDWLTESSLEELQSLSKDEIEQQQREFEVRLVGRIAEIRIPMDRLSLVLARVYPLDVEMIAELLDMPRPEALDLLGRAQAYAFVKSLPGERISLHDEMRRMVRDHVWPEIDPDGDRRRRDSRLAIGYFDRQIRALIAKIKELAKIESAVHGRDAQAELDAFLDREAAERELWALREQLLFHALFVDISKGVETFATIFDEATHAYRFAYRDVLLQQMERYPDEFPPKLRYEIDIRRAKYLHDGGQYPKALELLEEMADEPGLQPSQQVDVRIQLANVVIRLGKFQRGIEVFQEAVQISQEHGLKEWLAKAETGLGWAYRLIADLKEAGEHYKIALDLAIEINSKHQQGLLYGNLGYLYAYYTHIPDSRTQALWFVNESLALWEELEDKRGIGRSYFTLGAITFMAGQFDQAADYFRKSLDIFEPAQDREWLSVVYSWYGALCLATDKLDQAEAHLRRSLILNIPKDRCINLSRLGQLYLYGSKLDLDKAEQCFAECRQLALELPNVWYQLVSLRDLARLAFYKEEYERLDEFEEWLTDYLDKWEAQDLRALGMLYLFFGQLALGQSDWGRAVEHIGRGLELLAQQGRYGQDTPQTYMKRLEQAMVSDLDLSPAQVRDVGSALLSFWEDEKLDISYPNVRMILGKWARWEGE